MVPQLRRTVATLPAPDTSPGDHEPAPRPSRQVTIGHRDDGWWWCRMLLPPDEGAVVERMLEAGRDAAFADRHPDVDPDRYPEPQTPQPGDVSWAEGAVRAAHAALAGLESLLGGTIADRYQTLLHVDVDDPARPAHLHLGPALPAELRRLLACDTTLRVIFERAGIPVGSGRRRHSIPRRLRRIVENRDRGCRVPGCAQTRWLHIHHLIHWEDGGPTDLANLVALCPHHHRRHHLGRLAIDGDPNHPHGLTFTDPQTGRVLHPPPPRPPGTGPPTHTAHQLRLPPPAWQPPSGERLNLHWITWN